jgi:hypothetical protein
MLRPQRSIRSFVMFYLAKVELINWVPDTWTILELQRLKRPAQLTCIVYPGDGLPQLETERLREVFPGLELRSFEEALEP